jgi:hypothetical protein
MKVYLSAFIKMCAGAKEITVIDESFGNIV